MIKHRHVKLFTAIHGTEVAGYICLLMRRKTAAIYSLAVGEKYRGMGMGSMLLDAAERYACEKGAFIIRLEVRCTNKAVELYEKHGYSKTGIKKDYYGNGTNAFSMFKQLSQHGEGEFEEINTGGYRYNPAIASTASG